MKLTLQIKLLPDEEQSHTLLNTMKEFNQACNKISSFAWDKKIFTQFKIQAALYRKIKSESKLSAQAVIHCICKVVNSYRVNKFKKNTFKLLGSITYDSRILSYKINNNTTTKNTRLVSYRQDEDSVSIWSISGRLKIPFICHNQKYLPYIKGEADLVYKKGKFFLFQVVEVPEDDMQDVEEFIGVDFGITDIATLSDGTQYGSKELNRVRDKYFEIRRSIQRKGTKGCKKLLKRLKGRERRFTSITNHTISKRVVDKAKTLGMGIAIEDLTHIHERTKVRKSQRRRHHSWSFYQLRSFLEYKARLKGIPLIVVDPHYTSRTCNVCKHIGNRNGKHFHCPNCGNVADADINAAQNIAQLGLIVNQPEKSSMFSSSIHIAA